VLIGTTDLTETFMAAGRFLGIVGRPERDTPQLMYAAAFLALLYGLRAVPIFLKP
jgi:hypothetical protein